MRDKDNLYGFGEGTVRAGQVVKRLVSWPVKSCDAVGELYRFRADGDVCRLRMVSHSSSGAEYVFESLKTGEIERIGEDRIEAAALRGKLCRVEIKWGSVEFERDRMLSLLDWFVISAEEIAAKFGSISGALASHERNQLIYLQAMEYRRAVRVGADGYEILLDLNEMLAECVDHARQMAEFASADERAGSAFKERYDRFMELVGNDRFLMPNPGKALAENDQRIRTAGWTGFEGVPEQAS